MRSFFLHNDQASFGSITIMFIAVIIMLTMQSCDTGSRGQYVGRHGIDIVNVDSSDSLRRGARVVVMDSGEEFIMPHNDGVRGRVSGSFPGPGGLLVPCRISPTPQCHSTSFLDNLAIQMASSWTYNQIFLKVNNFNNMMIQMVLHDQVPEDLVNRLMTTHHSQWSQSDINAVANITGLYNFESEMNTLWADLEIQFNLSNLVERSGSGRKERTYVLTIASQMIVDNNINSTPHMLAVYPERFAIIQNRNNNTDDVINLGGPDYCLDIYGNCVDHAYMRLDFALASAESSYINAQRLTAAGVLFGSVGCGIGTVGSGGLAFFGCVYPLVGLGVASFSINELERAGDVSTAWANLDLDVADCHLDYLACIW